MKYDAYALSVINRDCSSLLTLAKDHVVWWPDLGFESLLSSRTHALLCTHLRSLGLPSDLAAVEANEVPAFKAPTPRDRILALLEECVKRELANAAAERTGA